MTIEDVCRKAEKFYGKENIIEFQPDYDTTCNAMMQDRMHCLVPSSNSVYVKLNTPNHPTVWFCVEKT